MIEHSPGSLNNTTARDSRIKLPSGLLIFYLLISAIILSAGIIFFISQKNHITAEKCAELSSIAELKVNQIRDYRNERYAEGNFLFGNQTFISTLKKFLADTNAVNKSHLNDWLETILTNHTYVEINIIDPVTNRITYSVGKNIFNPKGELVPEAAKCLETGLITFSDLTLRTSDSTIQLNIFVPLLLRVQSSIEKVAVVQFVIDPDKGLYALMQSWPTRSKSGEVLVVKKSGDMVLFLNELRFRKNSALKFMLPLDNNHLPAAWVVRGEESVREGIDYRNTRVLAATMKIPDSNWSVVVKIDTDEVYSGWLLRGILIFGLIILMLVALALGLLAFWRNREAHYYKSRLSDQVTINRLNRVYKLLSDVEHSIIKADHKEKLLKDASHIIFTDGGYDLCWVGMLNSESGNIESIAQYGTDDSYFETAKFVMASRLPEESNPIFKVISSGKHFVSNDIRHDLLVPPGREQSIHHDLKSMAAFPLHKDLSVAGIVIVYSVEAGYFSEDELKLLDELSMELSFALEKIDAEKNEKIIKKELMESEGKLRVRNEELASLNEKLLSAIKELKESNENIQRINQELVVAREKAEESDRLKSAFLANMSHEIRTPMNAIIGFAGFMGQSDLTEKERIKYSRIIVDRSDELLQIINDILDISKIESKTLVMFSETFLLDTLLDDLRVIYMNKLTQTKRKNIQIVCIKPPGTNPFTLTTDKLKFRQIFTNLLDNALKFTEAGEVRFGYDESDENMLTCFVSDTGIGIDQKYLETIFEIFRQAEPPPERVVSGTGLGLAICRGNAKLLGGDIRVVSEPGKGSKFLFSIMCNKVEQEIPDQKEAEVIKVRWKIKKILIIEDDEYSLEYLKMTLEKTEAMLHIARNGKEARTYYNRLQEIDLVLMDMKLPDSNGLNLVKEIKAIRKNLPVIAQTAFGMESDRINCLEAGCDDYISKPYKREELITLINTYL
jgi:signal transduction histidine kinase